MTVTRKGRTLYLILVKSRGTYLCKACDSPIPRGEHYYRDDPHPYSRTRRGLKAAQYCRSCIEGLGELRKEQVTSRIRVPEVLVHNRRKTGFDTSLVQPLEIRIVPAAAAIVARLAADPSLLGSITPDDFEEFVCDRLFAMGLEPKRTGSITKRDGGVDILFWPRERPAFPFLGAVQVKHHKAPDRKVGPSIIRDFSGVIAGHGFNAGIVVTNTGFTPDAEWFARERARLMRLRNVQDLRRWLRDDFDDEMEWREIPNEIELCPGVTVRIR